MRCETQQRTTAAGRLLPAALRLPAIALLAACAAVTTALGLSVAGQSHAGRLDTAVDTWFSSALDRFPALLSFLYRLGTLGPVTVMTVALVATCVLARRWSGAVLAAVAVPAASSLTEYVLKPLVGRTLYHALTYPSGHATSMFALAGTCAVLLLCPPGGRVPGVARLLLALLALLLAAAVAAAMVAIGAHYFTDAVAGAAVGTGTVLACALIIDQVAARLALDLPESSRLDLR
jgi:undecaprenyl-diphosphatase